METGITTPPMTDVKPGPNCRVAYTLNNYQPVRSTIIGDQPLFYLDTETEIEEDTLMDAIGGAAAATADFGKLQAKLQAYDVFAKQFVRSCDDKDAMFLANAAVVGGAAVEQSVLSKVMAELYASRLAETYLNAAAARGITIEAAPGIRSAQFDRTANLILVNPTLNAAALKLSLVRELRRAWLMSQGGALNPLLFHPDQAVLLNRVEAADLAVCQVRVAWELQLAGQRDVWMLVENSTLADLGRAFGREACMDFRSLGNGDASVAAFEAWFLSERCRRHDRRLIQLMLSAYQSAVNNSQVQVSRVLGAELIAVTGSQPYGKNYLSPYTRLILSDPVFTEVRDRSNANFLWFIKFERAFTEAEQDLQDPTAVEEKVIPATSSVASADSNLVQLFPAVPAKGAAKRAKPGEQS
jgi:hypothetical protein